jgi:hypothetical protein
MPPSTDSSNRKKENAMIRSLSSAALVLGLGLGSSLWAGALAAAEAPIIELTQVGCQFLESENGADHKYQTEKMADCEAINDRAGAQRLAEANVLELSAGKYVFRMENKNVPYGLGFWLRGDGVINRATLPSVSGGGLTLGTSKDYEIELEPGEYVYSCPLNPTPNYKLVVTE